MKHFLDFLAFVIYKLNKKHKKIAKANLDLVFKDQFTEEEKQEIIKKSYQNLTYNLYEFVENETLSLEGFDKKITLENEHYMLDAVKNKRKIILITAHFSNWEFGSSFVPLKYGPTTVVGRPLNNKYLNKDLLAARNSRNTTMYTTKEAGKGMVKALVKGQLVGLVIDQHHSKGIPVKLLGQKVKLVDSTARLAAKYDAVIIPLLFTRTSFGKYIGKFYPPIEPKKHEGKDQIEILTQKQADAISEHILANPSQWFWQHKRFKQYHREIYE